MAARKGADFAKATVTTIDVANLAGQASATEESLDESVTCGSWHWSAQASLSPLKTLPVINVAGAPLVSDWVAHAGLHHVVLVIIKMFFSFIRLSCMPVFTTFFTR